MRLNLQKLTRTVGVLCLLGILVSCQDTLPKRSTITQGNTTDKSNGCADDENTIEINPETGEPVDGSELTDNPTSTFQDGDKVFVCVPKPAVRPTDAVFWKPDFCACKDNKAVSYGNCAAFCSDKNTGGAETLYASFNVTESISLGGLGNLFAWCKINLPGDTQNPECQIEAKDENGNITPIEVNNIANSNSITANIQNLSLNKTYVLTLVEKTSRAKSNSVQLIKFSEDSSLPILGPLKNAPISQYACIVREFSEDTGTGDVYYDSAYRLHFYFIPRIPPKPVPAGNSNLICHDIFNPLFGIVDQELYPRFEQLPGVFNLWDTTDPRFFDNNGNGLRDVDEAIVQKTRNFGGSIASNVQFFRPFVTQSAPQLESDAGNNTSTQPIGWFMAPWIDQTTFKSYCLTGTQYNSNNPLFRAMRDIIGVDTEGLYIGGKAPETVIVNGQPTSGYEDFIFIRETDLKAVWFYLNNGVPTAPTDDNVGNKAVYFYYPLNKTSPFVRTSTQRIFRVLGANELPNQSNATSGATSSGNLISFPPHDRKIGCVPKF